MFVCLIPLLVRADEQAPDRQAETVAVQAWGRVHSECAEWSDGCVVCTREGCSTPGIACTPRETSCRKD